MDTDWGAPSLTGVSWVVAAFQMCYSAWRLVMDKDRLLDMPLTQLADDGDGYTFNWDAGNVLIVAGVMTDMVGMVAACVLVVGTGRRAGGASKEGLDYLRLWTVLSCALPGLAITELLLGTVTWDLPGLTDTFSRLLPPPPQPPPPSWPPLEGLRTTTRLLTSLFCISVKLVKGNLQGDLWTRPWPFGRLSRSI
jgi:hypothetical protein